MSEQINPNALCLMCMREKQKPQERCPVCGFHLPDYQAQKQKPHHLPLLTILNGRYLTGAVLGEGGFGITYSALDLVKEEHVAIKELFIKKAVSRIGTNTVIQNNDEYKSQYFGKCKDQFVREAEILKALKDKSGVVEIRDSFFENGTAYIAMEFLEGMDLREYLKTHGNRISFRDTFNFLRPVMKSMIEVQQQGVVHMDISPDNIRYLTNHTMKLMDFGSARSTSAADRIQLTVYKSGYTPPEQYDSRNGIGQWMDVYAMAATFYRCITGKLPKYSTERVSDSDLESPRALGADISEEVEAVIYKGMSLSPVTRYADIGQFYRALKKAIGEPTTSGVVNDDLIEKSLERSIHTEPPMKEGLSEKTGQEKTNEDYQNLMKELNDSKADKNMLYAIAVIGGILFVILVVMRLLPA